MIWVYYFINTIFIISISWIYFVKYLYDYFVYWALSNWYFGLSFLIYLWDYLINLILLNLLILIYFLFLKYDFNSNLMFQETLNGLNS